VALLIGVSRRVDTILLRLFSSLRIRWGTTVLTERLSLRMTRAGDVRSALAVCRQGVEGAVERGGIELAIASTSYGMLLLAAGWVGTGIQYLKVGAWMTAGWPSGRLRDLVLYALATGHAVRGEESEMVATVASQGQPEMVHALAGRGRAAAVWTGRLLALRAAAQLAAGDAVGSVTTYQDALDAALLGADRDLVTLVDNNLAGALVEAGRLEEAEARIAAAEALLPATSPLRAHVLGTKAELALARGDLAAARTWLDQSDSLKLRIGADGGAGWALATRARLEAAAGNVPEAKRLLELSAERLDDMGAVRAWRSAATALGEPAADIRVTPPAPDPLVDRAFGRAHPLPSWTWDVQRAVGYAVALLIGVAVFWFGVRLQDRIPGGWNTLTALCVLLLVALVASYLLPRSRRR
jgi:tetratricopeptide (TPR) repeat protein